MDAASIVAPILTLLIGVFAREIVALAREAGSLWISRRSTANDLIFPLVRVSDELVGRMYHHIRSDFTSHADRSPDVADITNHDHLYDVYLWARFWAHTSEIRRNILSYDLSKADNGKKLLRFLDCLEASKTSITPRAFQKFIGDGFSDEIGLPTGGSYYMFVKRIRNDPDFSQAMNVVNSVLCEVHANKRFRYDFIKYVIIVHVLNESLDPKRKVSSPRRSLSNKLDRKSRSDLRMRILRTYLGLSSQEAAHYS